MSEPLIKNWDDLRFTAVATVFSHYVEFVVYEIDYMGQDDAGEFTIPGWHRAGSMCHPDGVESLAESEPFMHGSVKWDGCSNWDIDDLQRGMIHACDREGLIRFGEVMARCWDWTADICPNWDGA